MPIVDDQIVANARERLQRQANTSSLPTSFAKTFIPEQIELISVPPLNKAGNTERCPLGNRQVDRCFELQSIVVAKPANRETAKLVIGPLGGVEHSTARSVSTKKRTLRPL